MTYVAILVFKLLTLSNVAVDIQDDGRALLERREMKMNVFAKVIVNLLSQMFWNEIYNL